MFRLGEVNTKTFSEMRTSRKVLHFGEVIWEKTTEKDGFCNRAVDSLNAFHFALLGVNGQLARVFGAYSAGVFYIVWFDLEHKVWPTFKRHT